MNLYKTSAGKIVDEDVLRIHVVDILGLSIEELVEKGVIETVRPTVEDCVRCGSVGLAVILHQQEYKTDIVTAFNAVQAIKKDILNKE